MRAYTGAMKSRQVSGRNAADLAAPRIIVIEMKYSAPSLSDLSVACREATASVDADSGSGFSTETTTAVIC